MKKNNTWGAWPCIITIAAVILALVLPALLIIPKISGAQINTRQYSISEYKESETVLKSPSSYDELKKVLEKHTPDYDYSTYTIGGGITGNHIAIEEDAIAEEAIPEAAAEETKAAAAADTASGSEYSDTNIRTEGVLEADIVKTDGRYIYTVFPYSGEFSIVDTSNGLETVYSDTLLNNADYDCNDFYVKDDRLYFAGFRSNYNYDRQNRYGSWDGASFLLTYDISDRSRPELIDEYDQSGSYISARMTEDTFYLFTNHYNYNTDGDAYIPRFKDNKIECEDIYYGKYFENPNFYCIGAVDLDDPGECKSCKAVLTNSSRFYVSQDSIFVISDDWVNEKGHNYYATDIVKISYEGTELEGDAIQSVPGHLNDSFSVDEYQGFLRLVTTEEDYTYYDPTLISEISSFGQDYSYGDYTITNSLWILDDEMNIISSLPNIQQDEYLQSARFMEDYVYFVTFRNTDPLFAADLSDPYDPKLVTGIELTGFSNYLHPWADGLLLGIGYEADTNGWINGSKLSMFDINNPETVNEKDRYVIPSESTTNSADYSYKAVLADPGKNLIGFAVQSYSRDPENNFEGMTGTYNVFSYTEQEGFSNIFTVKLYEDNYWYPYIDYSENNGMGIVEDAESDDAEKETASIFERFSDEEETADLTEIIPDEEKYMYMSIDLIRGLYINDDLYIVHPGVGIYQYDLNTGKLTNSLSLYKSLY